MNMSVRDVDPKTFREFKATAVASGVKTGAAVTQAMREWAEKKAKKEKKEKSFFDLKAWDWGKKNRNASSEVDEVLYGGHK
ncbi:MAG: hypothetical protein AABW99_02180 [archaeon]|mgnify:CR=1 FL=1